MLRRTLTNFTLHVVEEAVSLQWHLHKMSGAWEQLKAKVRLSGLGHAGTLYFVRA